MRRRHFPPDFGSEEDGLIKTRQAARGLSLGCSGAPFRALALKGDENLERGAKIRAKKNQQNRRKCQSEVRTQAQAARPQAQRWPRATQSPAAGTAPPRLLRGSLRVPPSQRALEKPDVTHFGVK